MWWSPQEESLQQQAEAAWAAFPEAQPGLPDIAAEMEGVEEELEDLVGEPDGLDDINPPQVFNWHLPEGAPDPIEVPPLQNGFHHAHEGELLDAFEAALVGFGQPPAANGQPG